MIDYQRFAKLDENNIVIGEIILEKSLCGSSEEEAITKLKEMYGWEFWKRSYFGSEEGDINPRKNYAYPGFMYDAILDAFKPITAPFTSWTRNPETLLFQAPITKPETITDGIKDLYYWDETLYQSDNTKGWVKA